MKQNNYKITGTIKELLQNPNFVMWCYSPTEETEIWWQSWMENNPERQKDVADARAILLSIGLNEIPFPEADSKQLYARIQASAGRRRKQRKQRRIFYNVSMPCLIWLSRFYDFFTCKSSNSHQSKIYKESTLTKVQFK